jgi:hypothetical protein
MPTIHDFARVAKAVEERIVISEIFGPPPPKWIELYRKAARQLATATMEDMGITTVTQAKNILKSHTELGPKAKVAYREFIEIAKNAGYGIEEYIRE